MTLAGLLGRALAVALLFGVVLLPGADHHLAGQLPGAPGSSVHRHVTHHHGARAERGPDAAPVLLPLNAAASAASMLPSPFADVAALLVQPTLLFRHHRNGVDLPMSVLAQPPPVPPPILPA